MFRIRPFIAEFLGTFLYVFVGAGVVVTDAFTHGQLGWIGIALTHGLAIAALITVFAPVSGAHLNPAVTLGLFLAKKVGKPTFIAYVIAQLIGAVLAGLLLRVIFPSSVWEAAFLGAPHVNFGIGTALLLEFLLSFFWMLSMLGCVVDSMAPKLGGLGVGLTVGVGYLVAGPLTGAAMNPARALGPALAANYWDNQWIFWLAPALGASLASYLYTRWISETI